MPSAAHGATVANVIALINREFIIILGIAALIGSFGGYYLLNALLGVFNMQHTSVGLFTVATCGLVIFCIGTATTGFTILRAAKTNPVETLKSE
ncbi:hypothetical protein WBG78_29405 [Chryseolinea sp. T2]|uniref:hypothetical protein n=1 Tax=Chryseolinea sp. T2 TaxID=3129255 RepID=UPI0030785AF5